MCCGKGDGVVDVVDIDYELAPAKSKEPPRAAISTLVQKELNLEMGVVTKVSEKDLS